jgi:Asp-tRNA(Asn)/Glu-tRNA(Gln) amidotransferase A subunit family amidase
VPELERAQVDALEDLDVAVTWLGEAEAPVRAAVARALERLPRRRDVELPFPDAEENALFMREVADVHRGLYPERADEYGENVRRKLDRCREVTDAEVERARRLRDEYAERCAELAEGVDLFVAPAVAIEPPPADADEREFRSRTIRLTYPLDCLGWPSLALPCGETANGLPAALQLFAPKGADALVLAAGRVLASLV